MRRTNFTAVTCVTDRTTFENADMKKSLDCHVALIAANIDPVAGAAIVGEVAQKEDQRTEVQNVS